MKTKMLTNPEIVQTVKTAVVEHNKALEGARAALDDARQRMNAAIDARDQAVKENDLERFSKANDMISSINDEIDLAERRLDFLKSERPLPNDQIDGFIKELEDQMDSVNRDSAIALAEHLDAAEAIAEEAEAKSQEIALVLRQICTSLGVDVPNQVKTTLNSGGTWTEAGIFVRVASKIAKYRQGTRFSKFLEHVTGGGLKNG